MRSLSVWAPRASHVDALVDGTRIPLSPSTGGWFAGPEVAPGTRYAFDIDRTGDALPDPRSPRQPDGVHGHSESWEPTTADHGDWSGRDVRGGVIYELHLGTFTPDGTFAAAAARLDHLVDLGVDAVEIMPVNAFNGEYGWGYDGVGWYAVHEPYGGPDGLVEFVAACHRRGLAVVVDAVYNHLGPSGNYLPRFGPYLTEQRNTWGQSINLDGPDSDEVRRFIVDAALHWFTDFGVDALRLDAVHALRDSRAVHILEELATRTDALAGRLGRPLTLIAESDLNDPRLVTSRAFGGYGLGAQWDDDVHHAVHTAVSGERQGYYADFGSLECLRKTLTGGFFHDGSYSSFRRRHHGRPVDPRNVDTSQLVVFTCDHDQIGNRAIGDRPSAYLTDGQLAVKAALILLSPFTPMLFQGEEWGARTPFLFFSSHPEPELAKATAEGRRAEFADHGWATEDVPDPQDPATFAASKLDWTEPAEPSRARLLQTYRDLIALRRTLVPVSFGGYDVEVDDERRLVTLRRPGATLVCNLSRTEAALDPTGPVVLAFGDTAPLPHRLPGHSFIVFGG